MKTTLIIIGIVFFVVIAVLLYLFIAGADESRKRDRQDKNK